MRVIAGKYRSRILKEVEEDTTRSTKDRVKESFFNSIQNELYDTSVLDLFAGSGALGIEALSRGAAHATFNEINLKAYKVIEENLETLKIENYSLFKSDFLEYISSTKDAFDIIFLDPPYDMEVIDEVIVQIANRKLLNKDGIIICLYAKNNSLKSENNGIIEYKKKTIGITNVSYMKWGV